MHTDLNPQATRRSENDMPMIKMPKSGHQRFAALLIAAAVTAVPLAAQAQRKSPLADAPAIRKRYELRASRLEVGAGLGTTINQDFFHSIFVNAKLGFHFTDWLALSVFGDFAVANVETTFQSNLVNSLSTASNQPGHPPSEPTKAEAQASMQTIKGIYGAQFEASFFTGKYSLFGKLFANYDFEILAGAALINVAPKSAGVSPCGGNRNRWLLLRRDRQQVRRHVRAGDAQLLQSLDGAQRRVPGHVGEAQPLGPRQQR